MLRVVLLFGVSACGMNGANFYFAVGWSHYELPGCKGGTIESGNSLRRDTGGFDAVAPGVTVVRCADGETKRYGVWRADALAIDGPAQTDHDVHLRVTARAGERSLDIGDSSVVNWSVSGPARIEQAYCNHPLFTCPGNDTAKLFVEGPGRVTVEAKFAGLSTRLDIEVTSRR